MLKRILLQPIYKITHLLLYLSHVLWRKPSTLHWNIGQNSFQMPGDGFQLLSGLLSPSRHITFKWRIYRYFQLFVTFQALCSAGVFGFGTIFLPNFLWAGSWNWLKLNSCFLAHSVCSSSLHCHTIPSPNVPLARMHFPEGTGLSLKWIIGVQYSLINMHYCFIYSTVLSVNKQEALLVSTE